jgi:hypothetical protein
MITRHQSQVLAAWLLALSVGVAGCGEEEEAAATPEGEEHSLEEEGCEHMKEGPSMSVTASAQAEGAPVGAGEHTRFDIALVDVEGGKGGYVTIEADEDGEFVLFLGADVPVTISDGGGAEVAVEGSEPVALCTEVAVAHTFDLEVGAYTLFVGPTEASELRLVFEHAGAHEEGAHMHDE